jgi:hypothetical protein
MGVSGARLNIAVTHLITVCANHKYGRVGARLNIAVTHLITVCANHKYGRVGGVAADGAEPELESGMLEALAQTPQEEIHRALGQEKLQIQHIQTQMAWMVDNEHIYLPAFIRQDLYTVIQKLRDHRALLEFGIINQYVVMYIMPCCLAIQALITILQSDC